MDFTSIIAIVVAIVAVYLFIKLIAKPIIKAVLGVIIFLALIYLLQHFGFDFNRILGPLSKYLDLNKPNTSFNWILGPINYYINKIISFFHFAWGNVPKK